MEKQNKHLKVIGKATFLKKLDSPCWTVKSMTYAPCINVENKGSFSARKHYANMVDRLETLIGEELVYDVEKGTQFDTLGNGLSKVILVT